MTEQRPSMDLASASDGPITTGAGAATGRAHGWSMELPAGPEAQVRASFRLALRQRGNGGECSAPSTSDYRGEINCSARDLGQEAQPFAPGDAWRKW